jgi:hypothetical protein
VLALVTGSSVLGLGSERVSIFDKAVLMATNLIEPFYFRTQQFVIHLKLVSLLVTLALVAILSVHWRNRKSQNQQSSRYVC